MTLYDRLGVAPGASAAELRAAYLAAARRCHPDFHTAADAATREGAERSMRALNEAWSVLGDPDRRAAYDADLRAARAVAWAPGTAHPDFVPVDGDDPDDEDDWRSELARLDDAPIAGATPPPRWQQVGPPAALAVSLAAGAVGLVANIRALLAVAVVAFLVALAGFGLTPLLEVLRANRRSR